jgi:N-methylhydantoinase A/oxoprolinase/acetone carboxylase beta subunit
LAFVALGWLVVGIIGALLFKRYNPTLMERVGRAVFQGSGLELTPTPPGPAGHLDSELRIGVDVGGTFTDIVLADDTGATRVLKVASTPDDPSAAAISGIARILAEVEEGHPVDQVIHGTTVATNMILEHRGCNVGLITTEGFRDLLHIARHKRPHNFSLYQTLPWQEHPLVQRRNRVTVAERIGARGEVVVPLDEDEVRDTVRALRSRSVEAIAICFLFSFVDSTHEERVADIVREEFPEAFLSVSSRLAPQYREFERFGTACLNAYIGPAVSQYIRRLATGIEETAPTLHVMTSAGGVTTGEDAAERPVQLLMSGPVAGVIGGMWSGAQIGISDVITLDVGGTSADIGLVEAGNLRMRPMTDSGVGGYQALIPMVDVNTIGTGGGSIAFVDRGGMYRVGPRSAGARPGPAAYGLGGTLPTITDAMVNAGWLSEEVQLGGETGISRKLAETAFSAVAQTLGTSVVSASIGALEIMVHSMAEAIEETSTRKGYDPRDYSLVAGGGAGPSLAAYVAREVGISQVVVPRHPGLMSAIGLLATDIAYEIGKTIYAPAVKDALTTFQDGFASLEAEGVRLLQGANVPTELMVLQRVADCRYVGQGYELRVECGSGPIDDYWLDDLREAFATVHTREYSMSYAERTVEVPTIRVRAIGLMPKVREDIGQPARAGQAIGRTKAWFPSDTGARELDTARCRRDALDPGTIYPGPMIVDQYDSTTVVPSDFTLQATPSGLLIIRPS